MTSIASWPCAALPQASLAERTTLGVGGEAEWLLEPASPDELVAAWSAARERGLCVRVLGGGANLLIEEGLHPGAVITTARLNRLFRPPLDAGASESLDAPAVDQDRLAPVERERDARLVAWAGATLPRIVRAASELGWKGSEGLSGVPGQLGGGVAMNAGGRWGDMWDVVDLVRVLEPDGTVRDLERASCAPRYRDGGLGASLVLGAVLRFTVDDVSAVKERVREFLQQKRRVQPVTERSAGCIFKNPPAELADGRSAGRLIEEAGCKGASRGDAQVSRLHGNFILNQGRATAADVFSLIEDVRDRVREHSGVALETEVKIWRVRDAR